MDLVNEHIKTNGEGSSCGMHWDAPRIICQDGFSMSVQASRFHYCSPRETGAFPYGAVEIGFPNRREPLLKQYAEDPKRLTKTVYGWVPIAVVNEVVTKHGGIRKPARAAIAKASGSEGA